MSTLIIFWNFFKFNNVDSCTNFILFSKSGMQKEEIYAINNFVSGRFQKLNFQYGKNESIAFSNENHLSTKDIIENYQLKICYKNSILGTKVIENYELIKIMSDENGVPCLTSMDTVEAILKVIESMSFKMEMM